jgi:hypothetical protein
MSRTIRVGVFETNSSSTHSLTIVSQEEFELWKKGKMLFDADNDCLVKNTTIDDCEENDCDKCKCFEGCKEGNDELQTYERWERCDLETFEEYHTTKSGDKIVVFGRYGYDG